MSFKATSKSESQRIIAGFSGSKSFSLFMITPKSLIRFWSVNVIVGILYFSRILVWRYSCSGDPRLNWYLANIIFKSILTGEDEEDEEEEEEEDDDDDDDDDVDDDVDSIVISKGIKVDKNQIFLKWIPDF